MPMFYDEADQIDDYNERTDYEWEKVDGRPRYQWYKMALNTVYFMIESDKRYDIENVFFYDLIEYYKCMDWVEKHDPDALIYILDELTEPVTQPVKDKLIFHLAHLKYYNVCAYVQKYLRSSPVNTQRTFQRRRDKYVKEISEAIDFIYSLSDILLDLKNKYGERLRNPKLQDSIGVLLHFNLRYRETQEHAIQYFIWLYENSRNDINALFAEKKMCVEIKEKLIDVFAKAEHYDVCAYLMSFIEEVQGYDYFEIPPYTPNYEEE